MQSPAVTVCTVSSLECCSVFSFEHKSIRLFSLLKRLYLKVTNNNHIKKWGMWRKEKKLVFLNMYIIIKGQKNSLSLCSRPTSHKAAVANFKLHCCFVYSRPPLFSCYSFINFYYWMEVEEIHQIPLNLRQHYLLSQLYSITQFSAGKK